MATGIPISMPGFELWLWFVGCGEGELVDVWDGVAFEFATEVSLIGNENTLECEEDDGVEVLSVNEVVEAVKGELSTVD